MKKSSFNMLLCGALAMTSAGFVSCGDDDDIDKLKTRVSVVEGMIGELQTQLRNAQVTGATVVSAEQDDKGVWTITLSDDKVITIVPTTSGGGGTGGGGSTVSVVDNTDNIIITVDGTQYVLPKGAAAVQLLYRPTYEDGIELFLNPQPVAVQFYMEPALTQDELNAATIEINEANVLATRAADSRLFKLSDGITAEGNVLTLPIKALEVEPGKSYALNIKITSGSKTYLSNYFIAKVDAEFSFVAYEPVDVEFASFITDANKVGEGTNTYWTATLPVGSGHELVDDFNFKEVITNVPEGAVFEIGSEQNAKGREKIDLLRASLKADGSWSLSERPGTDFASNVAGTPDGIQINVLKDDVVKMKVYFKVIDPLADLDFASTFAGKGDNHIEINPEDGSGYWLPGVNSFDIQKAFSDYADGDDAALGIVHGEAVQFLREQWSRFLVSYKEEGDVLYNDGHLQMGEVGKKYAKASKGLYWYLGGAAVTSSNRRNIPDLPETDAEKTARFGASCNGEIIDGWDWIPENDWRNVVNVDVTEDGKLVTGASYPGWGMRIHVRATYEYAYGQKYFGTNDGGIAFMFVNRRGCDPSVIDPAAR